MQLFSDPFKMDLSKTWDLIVLTFGCLYMQLLVLNMHYALQFSYDT